ncbi:hypothetical protein D3C79_652260 [compost metagenome]
MAQVRAQWADFGFVALRQALQHLVGTQLTGCGHQLCIVGRWRGQAQVVEDAAAEQHVVLQHHAHVAPQVVLGQRTQVDAVQLHGAVLHFVETRQQLHQGALAMPRGAVDHRARAVWRIGKTNRVEVHLAARPGQGVWRWRVEHLWAGVEQQENALG